MAHDPHSHRVINDKVGKSHPHRTVDFFAYVFGIIAPLFTLSQSYLIWSTQDASNLSLLTWGTYFCMAVAWTVYGFVHKEKLMIISNIIWMLGHASVVLGIILYS